MCLRAEVGAEAGAGCRARPNPWTVPEQQDLQITGLGEGCLLGAPGTPGRQRLEGRGCPPLCTPPLFPRPALPLSQSRLPFFSTWHCCCEAAASPSPVNIQLLPVNGGTGGGLEEQTIKGSKNSTGFPSLAQWPGWGGTGGPGRCRLPGPGAQFAHPWGSRRSCRALSGFVGLLSPSGAQHMWGPVFPGVILFPAGSKLV